jgi:TonB family protein
MAGGRASKEAYVKILSATLIAITLMTFQTSAQNAPLPTKGGGVLRVGNGVSPPVLISKIEPQYTEEARRAKYEGTAVLYAQIEPSGQATHIKMIKSLGLGLDQKAMEAVATWKFQPGTKAGAPVTVEATVEVNFRLLGSGWTIARSDFSTGAGASKPLLRSVASPPKCKSSAWKVTLSLTVGPDGRVSKVQVTETPKSSLNGSVADSVKTWTFDPAMLAGAPQTATGQIDVVCSVNH